MDPTPYENPRFYFLALRILGIFGTLFNALTTYIILKHSPPVMRTYRYYLVFYQILSSSTSLILPLAKVEMFPPKTVLRLVILWPEGGAGIKAAMSLGMFVGIGFCTANTQCVVFKHNQLLPPHHRLRFHRTTYILLALFHYIGLPAVYLYGFQMGSADLVANSPLRGSILEQYPEYASIFLSPNIWIYNLSAKVPLFGVSIFEFMCILGICMSHQMVFVSALLLHSYHLLKRNTMMSESTKRLQKKLVQNLSMQVSIPGYTIVIPALTLTIATVAEVFVAPALANAMFLLFTCYGPVSSISIIAPSPTYRRKLFSLLARLPSGRDTSLISVEGRTRREPQKNSKRSFK
ncbi:unnamed protein product, partial [Mesorhabditis spiculigera]